MNLTRAAAREILEQQADSEEVTENDTTALKITSSLWKNWVLKALRDFLKSEVVKKKKTLYSFIHSFNKHFLCFTADLNDEDEY